MEHFDVVIIGAGLSGIGGACRLQTQCPGKRYVILEARSVIGGTWDLFRYPGIRSDSDMFTLSYPFRPWTGDASIAEGSAILDYVRSTAAAYGIENHIRFHHRVTSASWSSTEQRWTIEAGLGDAGEVVRYGARFLYLCSGYYRYEAGYQPDFPGADTFAGPIVYPQHWPEDLDYRDRKVVIIGSGATAMTLAPAMARTAAHVTILQRSPTYVLSLPAVDHLAQRVRRLLPERAAYRVVRWKNVLVATAFFQLCRRQPHLAKWLLRRGVVSQLPKGYAVDPNFAPPYDPWDQRMCIVPDGDLFKAISSGRVTVLTDRIDHLTPAGIALQSGDHLDADLIVSATGLALLACGGIRLDVDGEPKDPSESFIYEGFMLSGLPNLAMCFGYTNASWTLRADLVSRSVCRLLKRMDREGATEVVPRLDSGAGPGAAQPLLDLRAGYVTRASAQLPKQGSRGPWKFRQNYIIDRARALFGRFGNGLSFSAAKKADVISAANPAE